MNSRLLQFAVLLFLALTWGSSFILMKKGLFDEEGNPVFSPVQVATLRLTIAAIALLPISIVAIRKISKRDLQWIVVVAIFGSGMPAFLFTAAQKHLPSSLAGILNSLTPLFTLLVGIAFFGKKSSLMQVIGVALGLAGAVALISIRAFESDNGGISNSDNWQYALLIVLATFSYGISVTTVQYKLKHVNAMHISALGLLLMLVPVVITSLLSGTAEVALHHPSGLESLWYICILAVAGTAVATIVYFWLAQQTTALFASSVAYLMPIVAVMWGIEDGEKLGVWHLLSGALIIFGVYLVNYGGISILKRIKG